MPGRPCERVRCGDAVPCVDMVRPGGSVRHATQQRPQATQHNKTMQLSNTSNTAYRSFPESYNSVRRGADQRCGTVPPSNTSNTAYRSLPEFYNAASSGADQRCSTTQWRSPITQREAAGHLRNAAVHQRGRQLGCSQVGVYDTVARTYSVICYGDAIWWCDSTRQCSPIRRCSPAMNAEAFIRAYRWGCRYY